MKVKKKKKWSIALQMLQLTHSWELPSFLPSFLLYYYLTSTCIFFVGCDAVRSLYQHFRVRYVRWCVCWWTMGKKRCGGVELASLISTVAYTTYNLVIVSIEEVAITLYWFSFSFSFFFSLLLGVLGFTIMLVTKTSITVNMYAPNTKS